jgi:PTS system nitrogen regulatory IIA component
MSARQMNLEEAAAYLRMEPIALSRLVRQGEAPYSGDPARPLFQADNLDAWASKRILGMDPKRLAEFERGVAAARPREEAFDLLSLAAPERVFLGVEARTKASLLSALVDCADSLGLLYDPKDLLESLRNREDESSTALPGGIAIPHPRHHDPYLATESFLVVARPLQPIHFGASDGKPSDLFFLLVCQDERLHLRALARLCATLSNPAVAEAIRGADSQQEAFAALSR